MTMSTPTTATTRSGVRRRPVACARRLAATAALSVMTLLAVACGTAADLPDGGDDTNSARNGTTEGAVRGGTLNMLGSGDVDYMDPNVSYYSIGYLGLRNWSRQLFTYPADPERNTEAVPDLAEEIPTKDNGGVGDDGLSYTITIREGARWNTEPARQVTAADAVRGLKRTCNPVQPFGGIPDFAELIVGYQEFCDGFLQVGQDVAAIRDYVESTPLPGVTARDERTVEFTLTHPATYFVDMLTLSAFSPAPIEVLDYLPASLELAQNQISNGPYQIESYTPTREIVFARNPAWDPETDDVREAFVDRIVVNQTVSQESTQQQLQTGSPTADMEWDNYPPASLLPGLLAANDPNLNLGETASSNPYIVFNTVSPNNNGALGDVTVRTALMHALNRGNFVQSLGGPQISPPLTHVLPPNILGSQDIDPYGYDPQRARELLAEAGYPDGLTLKMLYRNASEGSSKVFATAQQDLAEVGITLQGVPSPNADFYTKYLQVPDVAQRGVWDLAVAGWGADWYGNAALSYFKPLFAGASAFPPTGSNFGFYDSAALAPLIDRAVNAQTEEEAAQAWADADAQVMADAAFFPITNPRQPNYHAAQVHNAVYIPLIQNFDPTNVWLEPGKQGS